VATPPPLNPQISLAKLRSSVDTVPQAEWALGMKNTIANYLQEGPDGKFYYRMVDTVLSRDKNWVRWKMENCPPIARPPIATADFATAKSGSKAVYGKKPLRKAPMAALNLNFLTDTHDASGSEVLKNHDR
jgi:THO complex subunit 1